jgi:hypothetical protein
MSITSIALVVALGFSFWALIRDDVAGICEAIILLCITMAIISANH